MKERLIIYLYYLVQLRASQIQESCIPYKGNSVAEFSVHRYQMSPEDLTRLDGEIERTSKYLNTI